MSNGYTTRPYRRPVHVRVKGERNYGFVTGLLLVLMFAVLGAVGAMDVRLEHLESHAPVEEPYRASQELTEPIQIPTDNVRGGRGAINQGI